MYCDISFRCHTIYHIMLYYYDTAILWYYDIIIRIVIVLIMTISETFTSCAARPVIPKRRLSRGKLGGSGYSTGHGNGVFRILDFTVENHDLTWPVLQIAKHEICSHVDVGSCWIMLAGRSESWLHLARLGWRLCFLIHGPPCLAETSVTALK